jgi:hypothetical protein
MACLGPSLEAAVVLAEYLDILGAAGFTNRKWVKIPITYRKYMEYPIWDIWFEIWVIYGL